MEIPVIINRAYVQGKNILQYWIIGKSAYFQEHGQIKELKFNFRSAPEIVDFNNQLFKDLVEMNAATKAPTFYNSLSQDARSNETGFVRIISHKGKRPFEETMDDILKIIQKCDEDEFKRGDICILTEKNNIILNLQIFLFLLSLNN